MTPRQKELAAKHGTPAQFEAAVWQALGEISVAEANEGIMKYRNEWLKAASPQDERQEGGK